jgi:hypothetical protein
MLVSEVVEMWSRQEAELEPPQRDVAELEYFTCASSRKTSRYVV